MVPVCGIFWEEVGLIVWLRTCNRALYPLNCVVFTLPREGVVAVAFERELIFPWRTANET